jgi:hypothetical protein
MNHNVAEYHQWHEINKSINGHSQADDKKLT